MVYDGQGGASQWACLMHFCFVESRVALRGVWCGDRQMLRAAAMLRSSGVYDIGISTTVVGLVEGLL